MEKIFQNTELGDMLKEFKTMPFAIKSFRGKPSLEQTKRNKMRGELEKAFAEFLDSKLGLSTILTNEGIAIELANDSVAENCPESPAGVVTFLLELSVKTLDYDALEEAPEETK